MFEPDEGIDLEMFQADGPGHANTMPQDEVNQTGMSQREMLGTEPFGIEVTGSWMLIVHCCLHHVQHVGTEPFGIEVTGSGMLIVRCCLHHVQHGQMAEKKNEKFCVIQTKQWILLNSQSGIFRLSSNSNDSFVSNISTFEPFRDRFFFCFG